MSILSRKRDLIYLVFFVIHLPVMFCVDLYPLYPKSIKPDWMHNLRDFYIDTYHDQFFVRPPTWFTMYMWMEAIYHVPLSFWAIGALLRSPPWNMPGQFYRMLSRSADDPKLSINLLIYAVQTAITTATCIADYLSWSGFSNQEKLELGKLYVPYLALSVFMAVDMWARLDAAMSRRQVSASKKAS